MDSDAEILKYLREAVDRSRGYADFFSWVVDRDLEEWGVATTLSESLARDRREFFFQIRSRGRPNDPPDCEALTGGGQRIAIEVTELVDGKAIHLAKVAAGRDSAAPWSNWSRSKFLSELQGRLNDKDARYPFLKDPPYPGGYIVIVHTDEPMLEKSAVAGFLDGHRFATPRYTTRAFLQLSYDPSLGYCPHFELHSGG